MNNNLTIEDIKKKAAPILKEAGVTRSALFGSYVRGEQREDSDIDILIDFPRGKSLFDLVDLEDHLKVAFGKDIDVITYNSLHPLLRDRILQEQVQIL